MIAAPARFGRRAAALVVAALVLGAGACGGDDGTTASTDTTAGTTTAPADTAPTTAPPGTVSQPTAYTATAEDAVNELKTAWEDGDRERALAIAPGDVVEALLLVPPEGFEIYGCDTGEFPTSVCNYRNRGTGAFIKVSAARSDAGWQIATINVN